MKQNMHGHYCMGRLVVCAIVCLNHCNLAIANVWYSASRTQGAVWIPRNRKARSETDWCRDNLIQSLWHVRFLDGDTFKHSNYDWENPNEATESACCVHTTNVWHSRASHRVPANDWTMQDQHSEDMTMSLDVIGCHGARETARLLDICLCLRWFSSCQKCVALHRAVVFQCSLNSPSAEVPHSIAWLASVILLTAVIGQAARKISVRTTGWYR